VYVCALAAIDPDSNASDISHFEIVFMLVSIHSYSLGHRCMLFLCHAMPPLDQNGGRIAHVPDSLST
jgi:hypothetical protein